MADVFISYKRQDRPFVKTLARALQQRGFTVWWDSRIEAGDSWMACIKRALDRASTVVVVWTPNSVASDETYTSEAVASEASNGFKRRILLPVRIQNSPRPFIHDQRNEEDLSNWQGNIDDPDLDRLAGRISTFVGQRTKPGEAELAAWLAAEDSNNADAYRAFARDFPGSRFRGEAEPRAAEIERVAADLALSLRAAQQITSRFAAEVGKPGFVPPIDFTKVEGREQQPSAFERDALFKSVKEGGRFILSAVPGGGKTVALLDWAQSYCDLPQERIGVFLRLKELAESGKDLFEYLEELETDGVVSADAWKALARSGLIALFCDGWNELNEADRIKVGATINKYARGYPNSGIVIGTRPIAPSPFSGKHTILTLQRLTFEQVKAVVKSRLNGTASHAITELRHSHELRDLVKTPFFLTAFCETRLAGATPSTREGLVGGLIEALEQLPPHTQAIRSVFQGQQFKYLTDLSVRMLTSQQADLEVGPAMSVVNETSEKLLADRILVPSPAASVVLNVLRDHHCLIEAGRTQFIYRFQHQLIEEWYASKEVRRQALLALTDNDAQRLLDGEILNNRQWTEAVIFAVETPNATPAEVRSIAHLILRSMGIEPDFAASLISVSPHEVWQTISPTVRAFVDTWQRKDKKRAIRFVMQCGRDDFADHVWGAITAGKAGRVPDALDDHLVPHPTVLGLNWYEKYTALKPDQRADLLGMLVSSRKLDGAAMALHAASRDKEPVVVRDVAEDLDFYGFDEELQQLLENATPEAWTQLVRLRFIGAIWHEPWKPKALEAAQRVLSTLPPGAQRIAYALEVEQHGVKVDFDVADELLNCEFETHQYAGELYKRVAALDGERLSRGLLEKIIKGEKVIYEALDFIQPGVIVDQASLLDACLNRQQRGHIELRAKFLSQESIAFLFRQLHQTIDKLKDADTAERKVLSDAYHRTQDALVHANKNTLAETILASSPETSKEIGEICEVVMRAYSAARSPRDTIQLTDLLREKLTQRLAEWAIRLTNDPDVERDALHHLAEAMASFPSTFLLEPIRQLLSKELEMWASEKREFERVLADGKRPDSSSGARIGYTFRYAQNLLSLAQGRDATYVTEYEREFSPPSPEMTNAVIDVLSGFLRDPLFGEEAARVLAALRPDPILSIGTQRRFLTNDISVINARREERRHRAQQPPDEIAERVLNAIKDLKECEGPAETGIAIKLAISAIRMNCGERIKEAVHLVTYNKSAADISGFLMQLLLAGYEVDAAIAERGLDELDERRTERRWEYYERWDHWQKLLVVMIVGGKPLEAAKRLLTYDINTRNHDEQLIIEALGMCKHPDAVAALQLLEGRINRTHWQRSWYLALAEIASLDAVKALTSSLASEQRRSSAFDLRELYQKIAQQCKCNRVVLDYVLGLARSGDPQHTQTCQQIIRHLDDESIFIELLDLPAEQLQQMGGALADALKDLCVEHHPVGNGTFELRAKPIPSIRAKLFLMANADNAASAVCTWLLQIIDEWRDRYDQPLDENRHPNIQLGKPWPPLSQLAWDASLALRR